MCMKPLLSLLQFTTILPLGKPQDLGSFARHSYIYPCAGYIIGAIIALPVFFISDRIIASAVAIAALLLITGYIILTDYSISATVSWLTGTRIKGSVP